MQRQMSLVRRLSQLAQIILSIYLVNVPEDLDTKVRMFRDSLLDLMQSRGLEFTIKYVKTSRNCVMRYLSGEALKSCPGVALDSDGFPLWIS
jgi:hypothetical protein